MDPSELDPDKSLALPKFLQSFSWSDPSQVSEMHSLLPKWHLQEKTVNALELLDAKFADASIRSYTVDCLEAMPDNELAAYVLQLVQVLKIRGQARFGIGALPHTPRITLPSSRRPYLLLVLEGGDARARSV